MKGWPLRIGLAAVALAVITLFAAWWHHAYKRVERVLPLPPAGEAAYNPLYALKRALQADAVASAGSGLLMFAGAGMLDGVTGLPTQLLR